MPKFILGLDSGEICRGFPIRRLADVLLMSRLTSTVSQQFGLLKEHGEIGFINIAQPRQLLRKLRSESHAVFVVMREVAQGTADSRPLSYR